MRTYFALHLSEPVSTCFQWVSSDFSTSTLKDLKNYYCVILCCIKKLSRITVYKNREVICQHDGVKNLVLFTSDEYKIIQNWLNSLIFIKGIGKNGKEINECHLRL